MNLTTLIKAHEGIVYLFLILFIVKSYFFMSGKTAQFQSIRSRTKVLDMILGVLVLGTGIYLVSLRGTMETWVIAKLIIVLAAIPLAIIGFKKENKLLVALATLAFVGLFVFMKFHLYN